MNKRTLCVALVAAFLGVGTLAQAQSAQWAPARKITKLWTFAEGYRVFVPDLAQANPAGCSVTDYARLSSGIESNNSKRDEMNKTIMAAFLAGKNVRLRIHGTNCIESRPVYYAIEILQ